MVSVVLLACGTKVTAPAGAGGAGTGGSGGNGSGGQGQGGQIIEGDWQTLIEGHWEIPPGQEGYWCVRHTVTEDVYIHAFRAIAPTGTHHTLLTQTDGLEPDGESSCGALPNSERMLYASGVATEPFAFPPGVAVKVEAGTQLELNLHLFNTSTSTASGTSGTEVVALPAAELEQEAEMIFAGTIAIFLAPQSEQTINGHCEFPADSTVATIWPHMHQLGTHLKVVHEGAAGENVLHDAPYDFNEQLNYTIDPVTVKGGERVRVYCTYQNTTDQTITFGDSSNDEMCFAGLYRYPALGDGVFCDLPL